MYRLRRVRACTSADVAPGAWTAKRSASSETPPTIPCASARLASSSTRRSSEGNAIARPCAATRGGSDAAAAARSRRGTRGNSDGSAASPKSGFRKLLAPLVQSGTITRAEAGELARSSGDATAFRTKIGELMKAGKLTRKQVGELYSGAFPENPSLLSRSHE